MRTACLVAALLCSTAYADQSPLRIHLSPGGHDSWNGTTTSHPIVTLNRAHDILQASPPNRDVEIRIAPGTYSYQDVSWTFTMPEHTITFMPMNDDKVRPTFDACKQNDATDCKLSWFRLYATKGEATNLNFEYIRVENYLEGISFNGDREDTAKFNSHNRIYGMYFYKMGNKHNPSSSIAYAIVRLKNSDHNLVRNNHFVNCENSVKGTYLHALYVAHDSSNNEISWNRFKVNSGDAVRIRDYSNYNKIENNKFIKAGDVGYTEWFCIGSSCTKPTPECPSWGNEFRDNVLDGDYGCGYLKTWDVIVEDEPSCCPKPNTDPTLKRIRTSGNSHSSCSML